MQTVELVALKTVKVPHQNILESFRREIRALAALNHPGVIRIFDEGLNFAGALFIFQKIIKP